MNFSATDPEQELNYCYYGVRYAQPPLNTLRWKKPEPLAHGYTYDGDYTHTRPVCPQESSDGTRIDSPPITFSEDCLILNIWIPAGPPPAQGWPVQYFIHGGFLQGGTPNLEYPVDPRSLQSKDSPARFIVVAVGYRLNAFGFISSSTHIEGANFGHWDIRMGLEWVYNNIKHFGGNGDNITVAGVSAGAHCANLQLAYELYRPEVAQIIKRVHLISNAVVYQPKNPLEGQEIFKEYVNAFHYYLDIEDLMTRLRGKNRQDIVAYQKMLQFARFRTLSDGEFVSDTLAADIYSGKFGQMFNASGRSILLGEVTGEEGSYREYNTPKSLQDLPAALYGMYPVKLVDAMLPLYNSAFGQDGMKNFEVIYGKFVSDMQVYTAERLLVASLVRGGTPLDRIHRYRIDYRIRLLDQFEVAKEGRVPHGGDMGIWFRTVYLSSAEQKVVDEWLKPIGEFYETGEVRKWGTSSPTDQRVLTDSGEIVIDSDRRWDWAMKVEDILRRLYGNGQ